MQPLVTIAIPTFSRYHYLKEAVASALTQSYENIEVLIGDDGNNLLINKWCEQQAEQCSKIRYVKNPRNLGLAGNWNSLADLSRGEYLIIIGDDDRLLPQFVSKCVEAVLPDGAVVFCNQFFIDHDGHRLDAETEKLTMHYGRDSLQSGWVREPETCAWRNSIPSSAALVRTADVRRLRFKEDMNTPELELFVRLASEGAKFAFVPDFLAEYRVHPHSATNAGLRTDVLAQYLINVHVHPDVEKHKSAMLAKLMVNAVSRCLLLGDSQRARRLFWSKYYPTSARKGFRGWIQCLSFSTPKVFGCTFYKAIWSLKKLWSIRRFGEVHKTHS